jgi:POLO box duplicated region
MAALHSAPTWRFDEDGRFVAEEDEATRRTRKGAPPRSASRRQPFGSHDPNSAKPTASSSLALKKEKVATSTTTETGTSDMQRFVKNVLAIPSGQKSAIKPSLALLPSTAAPTPVSSASPAGFKIFDESSSKRTLCSIHKPPVSPKSYHHATSTEELIARTKALTVSKQLRRSGNELARSTSTTASSACSNVETEAEILQRMVDRLDTVLEVVETRRSQYRPRTPRATAPTNSLPVWVTRYVDYTSKYGLGFLLSDGSSGVYFNDSTKTALEAGGDTFQYVERKKNDLVDSRRGEVQVTNYTLTEFPDILNKKVTLLKHFRNYLMEQHKQADEQFPSPPSSDSTQPGHKFVYLKKWMRTKHAILFRLSNQTVQVVFYDQTEVLLTPDDRYITYVDKNHNRATYNFTDDVIGTFPELEKRIKYSRDIMHQLLAGQRQSIEVGVGAAALVR